MILLRAESPIAKVDPLRNVHFGHITCGQKLHRIAYTAYFRPRVESQTELLQKVQLRQVLLNLSSASRAPQYKGA